jgi:S-adenosylmethionine:tRNA ribosyltransferase-isomerase
VSRSPDHYLTSAFDYELPGDRIARFPAEQRDQSRLLVLQRETGSIEHRTFHDIIELIPGGDALVLNETRVFPARLLGTRPSGGAAEVLLLRPSASTPSSKDDVWEALVRPGSKLKPGRFVNVGPDLRVEILGVGEEGARIVRMHSSLPVQEAIARYGQVPLPPYIDRAAEEVDAVRYQTVYARADGSVAAPTAGLHFTAALLDQLAARGVSIVRIVLHVGLGTFRPVETENPAQHVMHAEPYEVTDVAAAALNQVRHSGQHIWAVGTTVTRTLETICDDEGTFHAGAGWTRLYIRPGYVFRGVDRLITNFHLPRSTLLMLVTAFGGYDHVMNAYRVAIDAGYRFYSYGDAMVIH